MSKSKLEAAIASHKNERQEREVLSRKFAYGTLSDDDVLAFLNVNNLGRRSVSPSERARGFAIVADIFEARRREDPDLAATHMKTLLSQRFGVSERTAQANLTIGRRLCGRGRELLDGRAISLKEAERLAALEPSDQEAVINAVMESGPDGRSIDDLIAEARSLRDPSYKRPIRASSCDRSLKKAVAELEKMAESQETPSEELVKAAKGALAKIEARLG